MEEILMGVAWGGLGLIWGSFLNALVWRLHTKGAPRIWQGRSLCPYCYRQILWRDNIPLLSFALLKGRCRFCQHPISWQYPIGEILTAFTFVVIFGQLRNADWLTVFLTVVLASCLLIIFLSDLIYGVIPDAAILAGVIVMAGLHCQSAINTESFNFFSNNIVTILSFLIAGVATAFPFWVFSRWRWMGEGDIGLAFLIGWILGFPGVLVALWVGFVLGGGVAAGLLALRKTRFSATIPLGPFLIIGLAAAVLWSKQIWQWLGV